jgi:sugar lactone lactonase YvrE
MRWSELTCFIVPLVVAGACGDDPAGMKTVLPAAAITDVIDAQNFGDGRDIVVFIDRPADTDGVAEYRIILAKDATPFDATSAAALAVERYLAVPTAGTQTEYGLAASSVDADGEPVVEGVGYRVHLLTVPVSGDVPASALDAAPAAITLRRTHLVQTITPVIQAGTGGMEVDSQGRIYHADFGATLDGPPGTRIHRISPTGDVAVWAQGFTGASGNAFDSQGNLYQSNIGGDRISRITPDGKVSTFATDGIDGPVGIAIDADGNLYVANCIGNTIRKVLPDGSTEPFASSTLFNCPNGITLASDGNFYVANFSNGDVLRITPDGTVSRHVTIAGNNNGHILFGNDVLYVVARLANRIYRVTLDGEATVLAGSGARGRRDGAALDASLSLTNDLALSPDGTILYFNDVAGTDPNIRIISPVVVRALVLVEGAEQ